MKTLREMMDIVEAAQQPVAEGLPQTLRKVVPGHAKREIDKKMDAGKFGKTDADKDANFQRYKKIQDKIKEQGVAEATGNPGMPHDFTTVQPGVEVWYKGRFAGWTTGKVYDDPYGKAGKMVAFEPNPSEFPGDEGRILSLPYDEVSLRKSTSIGKLKGPGQGAAEGSDELYQQAIRKYVQRVANNYLGGGNAHLYGAGNFDSEMFGVDPKQAEQDFDTLFPQYLKKLQGGGQGVAEGQGNLAKALDTLGGSWSGWHQVDSYEPDIEKYEWDDGEGGHYAGGSIEHNLKTGEVTVNFADEYNDEVKGTFKNMGDAMRALRGGYPGSHGGRAPNYDRLAQRTPYGPDDLRKTDRTGRKGTVGGGFANARKASIQHSLGRHGPKGVLPEASPDAMTKIDNLFRK